VLLNPALQFFGLAFDVLKAVIREPGPLLFQLAFDDVAIAFDFELVHSVGEFGAERSVAGLAKNSLDRCNH
jgi:hypothetical protein